MVEMLMHTAMLARHIRLRYLPKHPLELECQVNLRSKRGIYMLPNSAEDSPPMKFATLNDALIERRSSVRSIHYIEGENNERACRSANCIRARWACSIIFRRAARLQAAK